MLFRSLFPSNPGSAITALLLMIITIATFFTRATVAHHSPGALRYSHFRVRKSTGSSTGSRADESGHSVARSLSLLPPDTCLFYSFGLHQAAKNYAQKKKLNTIWDVYPNHTFPQTQNYTNDERLVFYRVLDREYARFCSGKGRYITANATCPGSLLVVEEFDAYKNNETWMTGITLVPGPYTGPDFAAAGAKAAAALPNWTNRTLVNRTCSDPQRFSGTDPHDYWGS